MTSKSVDASSICLPWYGIRTRSNYEQVTSTILSSKGYEPYVPFYTARKSRLNDAEVLRQRALFPGYVFCRFDAKNRLPILTSSGVVSVVGFGGEPAPISDEEIEMVKAILRSGLAVAPCLPFREGQRVRVMTGPLKDLEGILLRKRNECRMVVALPMLQRSISVEIEADRLLVI